jgi:hypothetical protein
MLATDLFVVPRLRISGDKPPLPLHVYMEWTGTTLFRPLLYLALLITQFFQSCSFNLISTSPEEAL